MPPNSPPLKIVVVGPADHGKSTLIGSILLETGGESRSKADHLYDVCEIRDIPVEWTSAEAAVLVIDAYDSVQKQLFRHGDLIRLLGLRQVVVAVNKMDMVGFDQARFEAVKAEIVADLASIEVEPSYVVPVEARSGANVGFKSLETPWYGGPSLLWVLNNIKVTPVDNSRLMTKAEHQGHKSTNITIVDHKVNFENRALLNGHRGGVVWLTGLSGSGKSTIAMEVERQLFLKGWQVSVLDGDNVRHGLCSDLGFSPEDRTENIRRVGEVAVLFAQAGMVVVTAFISPYRDDRDRVRAIAPEMFHEIHVATGLDECERRDPKGLYKKARAGQITDFTGISAPYEVPPTPQLSVATVGRCVDETVADVVRYIEGALSFEGSKRG
ncbi:MAG: adenylyl-sulfate kinase [Magnetospirillum sp.]|nr:MAG: adenylyl-sulfate kinase [Magnetospirillum sp.]